MVRVSSRSEENKGLMELFRFVSCLVLSVAIAGGVMVWMNKRAGLGAERAAHRAEAFADWYCARLNRVSCVPQLQDASLQPDPARHNAMSWRFRFRLAANRGITVLVSQAGRVHLQNPSRLD